ncbi:MAG: alanine--tRNA ligase [Clostridia bacterium]|nr:alanine--tRNA ligase [Clostridia bacterium]
MKVTSKQLRKMWLDFYKERGHVDIGAVSLIGDGTTGVMFNVAGMQPLMPYLLGQKHPKGTRLCNVQGCVRTVDIDSVGDESHCTFFEMMGNWSLGDYFKKEKTAWSFELLTKVFGFDKEKLCTTVFAGNKNVEKDDEIVGYLLDAGMKKENIYFLKENWWDLPGTVNTPCGPDNEWFYPRHDKPCSATCDATCECGRWVEIGNDVYMQYKVKEDGSVEPLKNKNVDTGFGFERNLMYLNGLNDVYQTDLFAEVIAFIERQVGKEYGSNEEETKAMRIIADHIRTAVMLIGDVNGILPSNVGAGYILRRLIRRALRYAKFLGLAKEQLTDVAKIYINNVYNEAYPLLVEKQEYICEELLKEATKFDRTLEQGTREFNKLVGNLAKFAPDVKTISGDKAFRLFDTFGFPLELTEEMANEQGFSVDKEGFKRAFEAHQEKSKGVAKGEFKSGLQDDGVMTTKYHTATHLLNAALKIVVGPQCHQMGSNITAERLRFDFPCDHKMTSEELARVENLVNDWIKQGIAVNKEEMPKTKAVEIGAEAQFIERYPDVVSVYTIGNVSKEICTGPHVANTNELGHFKIAKEEASSSGVRRIKAILD